MRDLQSAETLCELGLATVKTLNEQHANHPVFFSLMDTLAIKI